MNTKRLWCGLAVLLVIGLTGCGPAQPATGVTETALTPTVEPSVPGVTPTASPASTRTPSVEPSGPTRSATLKTQSLTAQPLTPTVVPTNTQEQTVTPLPPTSSGTSQDNKWVVLAKADLAQRLSIEVSQIALLEYRDVTWPDGSLGCPQPGMSYIQVLVEGYLIRLGVGKRVFEYHGGSQREPFLCENPAPPPNPGAVDK